MEDASVQDHKQPEPDVEKTASLRVVWCGLQY